MASGGHIRKFHVDCRLRSEVTQLDSREKVTQLDSREKVTQLDSRGKLTQLDSHEKLTNEVHRRPPGGLPHQRQKGCFRGSPATSRERRSRSTGNTLRHAMPENMMSVDHVTRDMTDYQREHHEKVELSGSVVTRDSADRGRSSGSNDTRSERPCTRPSTPGQCCCVLVTCSACKSSARRRSGPSRGRRGEVL